MMKSSHFFFLCCLFTLVALYFLSHNPKISYVDAFPRSVRKLSNSNPIVQQHHEYHKVKEEDEAMEESEADDKDDSMKLEYTSNSSSNPHHDIVYHIDYHGVTTHPTPKHPKP